MIVYSGKLLGYVYSATSPASLEVCIAYLAEPVCSVVQDSSERQLT